MAHLRDKDGVLTPSQRGKNDLTLAFLRLALLLLQFGAREACVFVLLRARNRLFHIMMQGSSLTRWRRMFLESSSHWRRHCYSCLTGETTRWV